jgi:ribonuclease HI
MAGSYSHLRCLPLRLHWESQQGGLEAADIIQQGIICYIDGSFSSPNSGGAAYILYHDQEMIRYELQGFQACSPFHSELQAMRLALDALSSLRYATLTILTDCLELQKMMMNSLPPLDIDWRLYTQGM